MLGNLIKEIFPDECQVLEVVPGTRYVYPIFKNGSTSLAYKNFRQLSIQEIENLNNVEVFVRNPHSRFLSGVQKYIQDLGPNLDKTTILYFIKNYLYLNRHFCPQLYWLINFKRFSNATFTLRPIDELREITSFVENTSVPDSSIAEYFSDSKQILYYNELDLVLTMNHIGQTVSMETIINTLNTNYSELYTDFVKTLKDITNVVSQA